MSFSRLNYLLMVLCACMALAIPTFTQAETSHLPSAALGVHRGLTDTARLRSKFTLSEFPEVFQIKDGKAFFFDSKGRTVFLTIDPKLQAEVDKLMNTYKPSYGAMVVMDPSTGAILAAGGSSRVGIDGSKILGSATFPAASLIKVVTAAAAVESGKLNSDSVINYRGYAHGLTTASYLPSAKLDRSKMTLGDALGKSCNPVFARLAFNNLRPHILTDYAERFGFNCSLEADFPVQESKFWIGPTEYDYARAAAGYDGARISPVHAASLVAAVGNGGSILRPYIISEVIGPEGELLFKSDPRVISKAVNMATAGELRQMMIETTQTGTARRHFTKTPILVAGKTGTLRGDEPKGLYHWFIGVAPASNPTVAVSSLVVDMGARTVNASGLASRFINNYYRYKEGLELVDYAVETHVKKSMRKKSYSKPTSSSKARKIIKKKKGVKVRRTAKPYK